MSSSSASLSHCDDGDDVFSLVVPQQLPQHQNSEALKPGPTYLKMLFRRFLERTPPTARHKLQQYLLEGLQGEVRVGTACSGTDGALLGWRAFADVCEADGLGRFRVVHAFSSEKDEKKQSFLRAAFRDMGCLFNNTLDLGNDTAYCCLSQSKKEPEEVFHLMAGFPCVDLSRLNVHNAKLENRRCLASASLSSGSVFHGLLKYIRKCARPGRRRLRFLLFENVTGLLCPPRDEFGQQTGPSNAFVVGQLLQREGYWVCMLRLCPRLFGVPQARPRLYILALDGANMVENGFTVESFQAFVRDHLNLIVGSQMQPLDDYILPRSHVLVQKYLLECMALGADGENIDERGALHSTWGILPPEKRGRKRSRETRSRDRWPAEHAHAAANRGKTWADVRLPDAACYRDHPGLHALSVRELDMLGHEGVQSFPEPTLRVLEVGQSLQRKWSQGQHVGACIPRCRRYITSQCRLMVGAEAMHLQSLWFSDGLLQQTDNNLLYSLAGNAFEVSCVGAAFYVGLLALAAGATRLGPERTLAVPAPSGASDQAQGPEYDDDDYDWEKVGEAMKDCRDLFRSILKGQAASRRL